MKRTGNRIDRARKKQLRSGLLAQENKIGAIAHLFFEGAFRRRRRVPEICQTSGSPALPCQARCVVTRLDWWQCRSL